MWETLPKNVHTCLLVPRKGSQPDQNNDSIREFWVVNYFLLQLLIGIQIKSLLREQGWLKGSWITGKPTWARVTTYKHSVPRSLHNLQAISTCLRISFLQLTGQSSPNLPHTHTHPAAAYCCYKAGEGAWESCTFLLFETCDTCLPPRLLSLTPPSWKEGFYSEEPAVPQKGTSKCSSNSNWS